MAKENKVQVGMRDVRAGMKPGLVYQTCIMCIYVFHRKPNEPLVLSWVCEWFLRVSQRFPSPVCKKTQVMEKSPRTGCIQTAAINKKELLELI